ncbi:MAG: tetratricopeptide repeat protein [Puniceicoccales bacterium]
MPLNPDNWFLRVGKQTAVVLAVLALAGLITSPVESRSWNEVKKLQPEMNLSDVEDALGQGMVLGLLGGMRTIIADFVFLRANYFWERKDRPNTEALIALTTSIDPRPMFFWLNGARMISYDIPVWRVRERGEWEDVPEAVRDRIFAEQAARGIAMMDRAAQFHPDDYRVPLEKAQIYLNKLEDLEEAAKYYKEVSEMPDAPYFAARIYAELLRRQGREQEAYAFLKDLYAELPPPNESAIAARDVVLERIRELEHELDVPLIERLPQEPNEPIYDFEETGLGSPDFSFGLPGTEPEPEPQPEPAMEQYNLHDHDHHGHDHDHDHDHGHAH